MVKEEQFLKRFLERVRNEWEAEKKREAEELHNRIADVLAEVRPSKFTLLYVIELIRFEVLKQEYEKIFSDRKGERR